MTLSEIKKEIGALSLEGQNELAAFIVHLKHQRSPEYGGKMRERLEDQDPGKWVSVQDAKQQIGIQDDSSS